MAHHFDKYSDHGTEEYLMRLKKACENKHIPYNSLLNDNGISNNDYINNKGINSSSASSVSYNMTDSLSSTVNPASITTVTTVMSSIPSTGSNDINSLLSSSTSNAAATNTGMFVKFYSFYTLSFNFTCLLQIF